MTPSIRLSGEAQIRFEAQPGTRYEIRSSENLLTWTSLGLFTNATPSALFVEPLSTNSSPRFYQVRVLE